MVKFEDFSRPLSGFQILFKGKFDFQGLFMIVLYIQVLFKPVSTLATKTSSDKQADDNCCDWGLRVGNQVMDVSQIQVFSNKRYFTKTRSDLLSKSELFTYSP